MAIKDVVRRGYAGDAIKWVVTRGYQILQAAPASRINGMTWVRRDLSVHQSRDLAVQATGRELTVQPNERILDVTEATRDLTVEQV